MVAIIILKTAYAVVKNVKWKAVECVGENGAWESVD